MQGSNTNGENNASEDTASAMGASHDRDEYILYDNTIKWKMSIDIKWVTGYHWQQYVLPFLQTLLWKCQGQHL